MERLHRMLSGEAHEASQRKQTHTIFRNILAEQHVYWLEQGRNALNFQQADFERAAQEYEQAARDEVHVAVAQATEMSRAEMRKRKAKKTWTSHQVMLLSEVNRAGDAMEKTRDEDCSVKQR